MKVGWIGLGQIGTPMALSTLRAGHMVTGHVRRKEGREELTAAGARLTGSLKDTVAGAEVVIVTVFDDSQLRATLLGPDGALAAMKPGSAVAIHTTAGPALARELAASAPSDVDVVDATFSGSAENVPKREIVIMAGGTERGIARVSPVISSYASRIFVVGSAGAGQQLKVLNNLLFAANAALAAEAVRALRKTGLDPAKSVEVLSMASGASFALGRFAQGRDPDEVLASLRHWMKKDVSLALAALAETGASAELLQASTVGFLKD